MTELLVILACSYSQGCSQTTSAYFISHPYSERVLKRAGAKAQDLVGPAVVAASPAAFFAATGSGTFKVTNKISLQLSTEGSNMIIFRTNF